jgi:hypothetical protein
MQLGYVDEMMLVAIDVILLENDMIQMYID